MNHIERYHQMLAARGLKVGDQVVCEYRTPYDLQWWIHPFWVGVIEEVSDDAETWNHTNSEASYCANLLKVRVRYLGNVTMAGFTEHDSLSHLIPLTGDRMTESPWFGGGGAAEAHRLYEFACRAGIGDRYSKLKGAA